MVKRTPKFGRYGEGADDDWRGGCVHKWLCREGIIIVLFSACILLLGKGILRYTQVMIRFYINPSLSIILYNTPLIPKHSA